MGSTKQLVCKEFTFNTILVLELFWCVDQSALGEKLLTIWKNNWEKYWISASVYILYTSCNWDSDWTALACFYLWVFCVCKKKKCISFSFEVKNECLQVIYSTVFRNVWNWFSKFSKKNVLWLVIDIFYKVIYLTKGQKVINSLKCSSRIQLFRARQFYPRICLVSSFVKLEIQIILAKGGCPCICYPSN